jgi:hypothetical protein
MSEKRGGSVELGDEGVEIDGLEIFTGKVQTGMGVGVLEEFLDHEKDHPMVTYSVKST